MSAPPLASDHHDALTGLPNRRLLDDRLTQALHLAQRRERGAALLVLAIGAFAPADEARVLEAARRLAGCVRRADTLARIGAAEFAVVLTDVAGDEDCRVVAMRLLDTLGDEVCMGISVFPRDGLDADALLRNAQAARSRAAEQGRRYYRFFGR